MKNLTSDELERFVLGSLINSPVLFISISDIFTAEMFYYPHNKAIAEVILRMNDKNITPDALNMIPFIKGDESLSKQDLTKYVLELAQGYSFISIDTVDKKAKLLYELYLRRKGMVIADEFKKECEDGEIDIFDSFTTASDQLVKSIDFTKDIDTPRERLNLALEKSLKAKKQGNGVSGHSFGINTLDRLGGASGGDLIIVAGYPGTFKTGLTMQIADNLCNNNVPTLFFEMEMSKEQFGMREIAMYSGINTHDIKTGNLTDKNYEDVKKVIGDLDKRPYYVDFRSGLTITAIKSKAKIYKAKKNIGAIFIDYLGLANLELKKYGGLEPAIDNFVRECKGLAKMLDVPVFLLAQFLKDNQGDKLKVPHSGLLKGSGAIEAHADIVLLTWNPSAVDPNFEYDINGVRQKALGYLGIVAAKNRQGSGGLGWVKAYAGTNRFVDTEGEIKFTKPVMTESEDVPFKKAWTDDLPF